jgi:arylsulfatase A-like enzyme
VQPDAAAGVTVPPYLPATPASRDEFAALQGAVHQADRAVGRMLAALDGAGLTDDTLVLFTADHGVAMPRAKCTLYDPGIGVALIVRWPAGGLTGGQAREALASNVDLLPTLLQAAGVPVPDRVQGRSFLPLLRGETETHRDAVFTEKTFHSYYDPMRGIRTDRYKLIRNFEAAFLVEVPGDVQLGPIYRTELQRYVSATHPPVELYDLEADPWEQENLAGRPEIAAIEAELDRRLWAWMAETGDPLLRGPVPSPSYLQALAARR